MQGIADSMARSGLAKKPFLMSSPYLCLWLPLMLGNTLTLFYVCRNIAEHNNNDQQLPPAWAGMPFSIEKSIIVHGSQPNFPSLSPYITLLRSQLHHPVPPLLKFGSLCSHEACMWVRCCAAFRISKRSFDPSGSSHGFSKMLVASNRDRTHIT